MSETVEPTVEQIAIVTHTANKAWCEVNGDTSQPEWKDAPDWQKTSALNGVEFHIAHPDASASASHENWLKEKEADGWTFGEVKDPDKKQHPCMVPFEGLPPVQQAKDRLFRSVVHALKPAENAEQDRADMEAIGRSYMASMEIVMEHPDWKDWAPADDPAELVTDMLHRIEELEAELRADPPEAAPVPEGARTTALDWSEYAPFSIAGTVQLAGWIIEGAEHSFIMKTEPGCLHTGEWWGIYPSASNGGDAEIIRYAIERRPSSEVLYNKMRELGHLTGTAFDDLLPYQRASFELAARIIPAVADVAEALNAQIVAKNPPAPAAAEVRLVDIEDTILESVDGMDEVDPEMAAAREKADQLAAEHAAEKKPKGKKRSIAERAV